MQPKKYIKINGVMKMNPEYKRWKEMQGGGAPATTVANSAQALPIITNMEEHAAFNADIVAAGGKETRLAESTNATIEMMQEPEISVQAGMVCVLSHGIMLQWNARVPLSHLTISVYSIYLYHPCMSVPRHDGR